MRTPPPPGKRLVSDWKGMRVKSLRKLRNAFAEMPVGTTYKVDSSLLPSAGSSRQAGRSAWTRTGWQGLDDRAASSWLMSALKPELQHDPLGAAHEAPAPASPARAARPGFDK
jgi:hypothetical protein